MADEYRRFRIASSDPVERERLLAEAFEAGAGGAEELDADVPGAAGAEGLDADVPGVAGAEGLGADVPGVGGADAPDPGGSRYEAWVYVPVEAGEAIRARVLAEAGPGSAIHALEALPEVDWSEAWKAGLEALRVSRRLVVRPPFVAFDLEPGQREIVIDPGQAFGTGAHASTALCLEWLDELIPEHGARPARLLDVGTGTGVLALAGLALGCTRAVAFDLDPIAIDAARVAARDNGLEDRIELFVGPIEQVPEAAGTSRGDGGFPIVLANLLKREMLPIAAALARCVAPGGRLVLAGLLEEDAEEVLACFAREGLRETGRRTRRDAVGAWIAPCLAKA